MGDGGTMAAKGPGGDDEEGIMGAVCGVAIAVDAPRPAQGLEILDDKWRSPLDREQTSLDAR